ncbi:MAG: hypothetical protein Q9227_002441 [Pyrenula ochraceoflavens]
MAKPTAWLLAILPIPLLVLFHVQVAPHTKVEESFNIQAVHDILKFGIPSQDIDNYLKTHYDHLTFSGAVPRTFVGALLLAGASKPFLWLSPDVDRQQLVRMILGLFCAFSLVSYAYGVRRAFGKHTAIWFSVLQASQFHVIYYASRPLPNMFAFGLTTLAFSALLPDASSPRAAPKRQRLALYLLTLSGVIFRSEIALLLFCHTIYLLSTSIISLPKVIIPAGLFGLIIGLGLSVPFDTISWQSESLLWPELAAFKYNIFPPRGEVGASAWGTSPWHWYFTSALPRLLLNPLTLLLPVFGLTQPALRHSTLSLLLPNLAYVAFYSFVPHKETRFIIYIIPPLTLAAALSASYIFNRRTRSALFFLLSFCLVLSTAVTFIVSHYILLKLSALTYPGAVALHQLHRLADGSQRSINVHLDNLPLQTGITRFQQRPPPNKPLVFFPGDSEKGVPSLKSGGTVWAYDKTGVEGEDEKLKPEWWEQFDYAIMEMSERGRAIGAWEVIASIRGLGRARFLRAGEEPDGRTDELLQTMYGAWAREVWKNMRELVRDRLKLTKGFWVEVGMEDKLVILRKERVISR